MPLSPSPEDEELHESARMETDDESSHLDESSLPITSPVLTASDLVFSPQANHNFSHILAELKRSTLSITNRLRSIKEDAAFVAEVAAAFRRPLIANERCGSWYIPPADKAGSAYFKSTDGHAGQWRFSTRRLNLHLLGVIGERDGVVIVDSTRRGKRMPDALSKTVPIWCCVLNRALFPGQPIAHGLYTPPSAVSESEHAQILERIPDAVESFKALGLDLKSLRGQLRKPLRPLWITQETQLLPTEKVFDAFHPVICCTSSRRVVGTEMSEGGYIQGAGDDTENWALRLTPPVFWKHQVLLSTTPEAELPRLVTSLVSAEADQISVNAPVQLTTSLWVGRLTAEQIPRDGSACVVSITSHVMKADGWVKSPSRMEVGLGKHKIASRNLRVALPDICEFVHDSLQRSAGRGDGMSQGQVYVLCESGKDLSVGVALALLCRFFDEDGVSPSRKPEAVGPRVINKGVIKVKLGRIMTAFPEANPSRATLQSVNSFLMG